MKTATSTTTSTINAAELGQYISDIRCYAQEQLVQEITARHEIGHALLMALDPDTTFDYVTINGETHITLDHATGEIKTESSGGYVFGSEFATVQSIVGGYAAEKIHLTGPAARFNLDEFRACSSTDYSMARDKMPLLVSESKVSATLESAYKTARRRLLARKKQFLALFFALLERRTLAYDEVKEIAGLWVWFPGEEEEENEEGMDTR